MTRVLLSTASHLYLFAALLYLAYFVRAHAKVALAALLAVGGGFALHAVGLGTHLAQVGFTNLGTLADALSLLGLLLAGGFLLVQRSYRYPAIGVFVTPLLVAVVVPSVLLHGVVHPLPDALKLAGLPLHVGIAFAGIAAFALATGIAVAYLVLERQMKGKHFGVLFARLPPLEVLDRASDRLMRWGFVALSITLLSGVWFAKRAWGDWWRWDPKLVLSLVAWAVYAGLVHARLFAGWRGRRAAFLTMVGFAILFGSFLGLKLFPSGLHTGDFK